MKSARVVLPARQNILRFPSGPERSKRDELAFLPAALEIVETPPSPTGRAIGATLVVLFILSMLWAFVGQVDIIASAAGKVIPSGSVKVIQPFETGVVRAIRVRDGQVVKAGDILIELDPTITAAEQDHIRSDLIAARLDVARLHAAANDGEDPQTIFRPPEEASADLIAMQRQLLVRQTDEYRAKISGLDRQRAQKEAERDTIAATINKLEADEPIIRQRVTIRKELADRELGSKLTYLEILQLLTENEKEIAVQQSRLDEATAALAAVIQTRAQAIAEFHRTLLGDLAEAERKAAGLSEDLIRARQRTKLQMLAAPVDGVVQQLSVHTVGGVVTPAQQLAVVVPSDATLEIEAMISNRDVGFVHIGQDVVIKIDTFNFTRYGVLHGRVLDVSHDAISRDVSSDRTKDHTSDSGSSFSEPKEQQLSYAARVSLDQTQIHVDDTFANLVPGMAATAEIRTGSRRIISYLLSPLLRYRQEAFRER